MTPFRYRSRIAEFGKAFTKQVAAELQTRRDKLVSPRNAQKFVHGRTWKTIPTQDGEDVTEMQAHSFDAFCRFEDVVDHDLAKFVEIRSLLIEGLTAQLQASLYETISQSAESSGNIVGSGQSPAEALLVALEMIEFGVEENGEVSLPTIHIAPDCFRKMSADIEAQGPEFTERIEQLKAEKSELARQKESERLAKFPPAWEGDLL